MCDQELGDRLSVSPLEFWGHELALYQSLLCPPTERFIFLGFIALRTWRLHGAFSLSNRFQKNNDENGLQVWEILLPSCSQGRILFSFSFSFSPHLCNKGVPPDMPFFISFSLVLLQLQWSLKFEELHFWWRRMGIMLTVFQMLTHYILGRIYQY